MTKRPLSIVTSKPDPVGALPGLSLAEEAYDRIRDEILRGNFALGDVLSRRRLAERFSMSFVPIAEALQRLEADGLVESQPRAGTRVRVPSTQDIVDTYTVREALETHAARMCCERITAKERSLLMKQARHLDRLYRACSGEAEDPATLFNVHTHHMQFHLQVARLSQSPKLIHAIEREQVLIFNWLYDTAARRMAPPGDFHLELASAICGRDVAAADATMRAHIRFGLAEVVQNLNRVEPANRGWRLKEQK